MPLIPEETHNHLPSWTLDFSWSTPVHNSPICQRIVEDDVHRPVPTPFYFYFNPSFHLSPAGRKMASIVQPNGRGGPSIITKCEMKKTTQQKNVWRNKKGGAGGRTRLLDGWVLSFVYSLSPHPELFVRNQQGIVLAEGVNFPSLTSQLDLHLHSTTILSKVIYL